MSVLSDAGGLLGDTSLLNVNLDLALDADVAAPIDAAVAANVASVDSDDRRLRLGPVRPRHGPGHP